MDPPELPVAQLVRLAGLFGFSENRARVALSRMLAAGEATTDGTGVYRLAGHLAERRFRQSASRSGITAPYAGRWYLVVVTTAGSTAEVRSARRRTLTHARLAALREGVWMRPDNVEVKLPDDQLADLEVMTAHPADPARLVDALWDLRGWSNRARLLLGRMDRLTPEGRYALAPDFELSAAVLRHLQADPLLPDVLLPEFWPGALLRTAYDRWDAQYRVTLREWSRTA
jgi:phenylacetic acid degradation operon negative regulatory protein